MFSDRAALDMSECHVSPRRMLLHHPRHGLALEHLSVERLIELNFLGVPAVEALYAEYEAFVAALAVHVEPIYLNDVLSGHEPFVTEAATNPNLIFMRDSSITLPWVPNAYIPARPALASRAREVDVANEAMRRLGLTPLTRLEHDEFLEGGDVLPVTFDGKRVLLIGFGVRTTKAAAIKLALDLIPEHVDYIIGLSHDPDLLHLDTGFTVLPEKVLFAAAGMFTSGFLIDEDRRLSAINPLTYAMELGCRIVRCDRIDAILHERCNLLPLGSKQYLAFDMPQDLKSTLEEAAGINIVTVDGQEIAKATGGVHCLTRPLYI